MKTEIELAKQAGWEYADDDRGFEPLWRFAELVRADERARMAEQPAQQEQEPLVERFEAMHGKGDIWITTIAAAAIARSTSPQTQPSQQSCYCPECERLSKELAELKGQRTWVGLTTQEVQEIHDTYHKRMGPQEFAQAIEAKLKEKNT